MKLSVKLQKILLKVNSKTMWNWAIQEDVIQLVKTINIIRGDDLWKLQRISSSMLHQAVKVVTIKKSLFWESKL